MCMYTTECIQSTRKTDKCHPSRDTTISGRREAQQKADLRNCQLEQLWKWDHKDKSMS